LEKMQLDLPKTFFFFLTVHWKMKCNKKYVKAIDKRSSPPICVKSRAQSRDIAFRKWNGFAPASFYANSWTSSR